MKIYVLQSNVFGENRIELYSSVQSLLNDPENDVNISAKTFYNYLQKSKSMQLEAIERYRVQDADISDLPTDGYPITFDGNTVYLRNVKYNKYDNQENEN